MTVSGNLFHIVGAAIRNDRSLYVELERGISSTVFEFDLKFRLHTFLLTNSEIYGAVVPYKLPLDVEHDFILNSVCDWQPMKRG